MKFIVKQPGLKAEVMGQPKIKLADLQHYVEGTVTCPAIPGLDDAGATLWANDDGLCLQMQPNVMFYDGEMVIVGPIMVTGINKEGNTVGLTATQIKVALVVLEEGEKLLGKLLFRRRRP